MKLKDAIHNISLIKKVKISQSIVAEIFGVSRQRISAMQENQLKDFQIKKLEEYFEIKIADDIANLSTNSNKAFSNQSDLTKYLTEQEFTMLEEVIKEDKETFFLFYRAWKGDSKAFKALEILIKEVNNR